MNELAHTPSSPAPAAQLSGRAERSRAGRASVARLARANLVVGGAIALAYLFDRVFILWAPNLHLAFTCFAPLWCLIGSVVIPAGLTLWALAALLGRSAGRWSERWRECGLRLALAASFTLPALALLAVRHTNAYDHLFIALYEDALLRVAENPEDRSHGFFCESNRNGRALIGAVNYSISDYYWVIHDPAAGGRPLEDYGDGFSVRWARHVRGPWYVMFR
jgi:hypothetical protein